MRAPTQKAIMRANTIEWSVGGCDCISVTRSPDGWRVFDSRRGVRKARDWPEHKSLPRGMRRWPVTDEEGER